MLATVLHILEIVIKAAFGHFLKRLTLAGLILAMGITQVVSAPIEILLTDSILLYFMGILHRGLLLNLE